MVSAVVLLVLLVLYFIFRNQIIPQTRHALEDKAYAIARTIALIPLVSDGLSSGSSKEIQAYTSKITRRNDIMFVVVIDMNSIRYSHPDAALIGKPFAGAASKPLCVVRRASRRGRVCWGVPCVLLSLCMQARGIR